VKKVGYLDGAFGQETALENQAARVSLTEGQLLRDLRIKLWRFATIEGTVRDELGSPVVAAYVRVFSRVWVAGHLQLAKGPLAMTDDNGHYRITGLRPGRYSVGAPVVNASVHSGDLSVAGPAIELNGFLVPIGRYPTPPPPSDGVSYFYTTTLSPSSVDLMDATTIDLTEDSSRPGVDIQMVPFPVHRLGGTVTGSDSRLTLRLVRAGFRQLGMGSETATALVRPDGSFLFPAVPDGDYHLLVGPSTSEYSFGDSAAAYFFGPQQPRPPGLQSLDISGSLVVANLPDLVISTAYQTTTFWCDVSVAMAGKNIENLEVALRPSSTVKGRITLDRKVASETQRLPNSITIEPADGSTMNGTKTVSVGIDGTFEFTSMIPGYYLIRSPGWLVESTAVGGQDHLDLPFVVAEGAASGDLVVTLTDRGGSISGTIPVKSDIQVAVMIFPGETRRWTDFGLSPARIRTVRADSLGRFSITPLPAGDYCVVALGGSSAIHLDPSLLESLQGKATPVHLSFGERKTVDIRSIIELGGR
jgi:protocatechuate 3,4-dioxygenase beta subunit